MSRNEDSQPKPSYMRTDRQYTEAEAEADIVEADTVEADTVEADTVDPDTLEPDTMDTLMAGSVMSAVL
jgi:hypothetical protein